MRLIQKSIKFKMDFQNLLESLSSKKKKKKKQYNNNFIKFKEEKCKL